LGEVGLENWVRQKQEWILDRSMQVEAVLEVCSRSEMSLGRMEIARSWARRSVRAGSIRRARKLDG